MKRIARFVGLVLMLGGVSLAQAGPPPKSVLDLHYGEVLFHFYQDQYFDAITRLLAAREQERVSNHAQEAELLLGGMSLSYGQQDTAARIFERLLDEDPREDVRNHAWFQLARISYQRAQDEQAVRALEHVGDDLPRELEAERRMLVAQLAMQQGRFGDAVATLDGWRAPGDWRDYARFNLGVALIRHGELEQGTAILEKFGAQASPRRQRAAWTTVFKPWRMFAKGERDLPVAYEERAALADKANVALGFAYLQSDAPEQAVAALERVGNEGPWTGKALLGLGWASASMERYDEALGHWRALSVGDGLDPAVQESWLAVPYAFGKLESWPEAVDGYVSAISAFDAEVDHLDRMAEEFSDGRFLTQLLHQASSDDLGWYWELSELPDTAEARYLYHLLADHRFQEGLKNYRDLRFLQENLVRWESGVNAFATMLETRELRYLERMAPIEENLEGQRLADLEARATRIAERFTDIEARADALELATVEQHENWERLQRVEERLARLPAGGKFADARDKHRLFRGVLLWDLNEQYPQRLWDGRKALRGLDDAIAEAHGRSGGLVEARDESLEGFGGFRARLDSLGPRINALQGRVSAALDGKEAYLERLALQQLDGQRDRLRAYLTEAQYALASVYDGAAHAEDIR